MLALLGCLAIACFLTWFLEWHIPKKALEDRYGKGDPRVKEELRKMMSSNPGPG